MRTVLASSILLCVGLVIFSLFLANFSNARIDPDAVVGMWLFDEGKGNIAEDSSGNVYDGNIMGVPKRIDGKFGEAMEFAGGGDSIVVPDNEALNFGTDSFTVVTWLRFSTPQDWNRLVRERNPSPWGSGNYGWEIQTQGVQIHFSLDDMKGNHQKTTYADIGDGEWHHGAMVVNREKKLLVTYMDGENERSINIANIESVTDILPVTIGGGFAGALDEVGVFKGVLDQDDIVDIMNKGLSEATKTGAAVSPAARIATTWAVIKTMRP